MSYGYIYKITTSCSEKVYIGQTIRTIEKRWQEHLNARNDENKKSLHLYLAMNKYGVETFSIEKIDEASSQEELDEKEIYWISFYNSIENGYNMAPGGVGTNIFKSEKVKEKHSKKMKDPKTKEKISKSMHELRTIIGFSPEHKYKIRQAHIKRKEERLKAGLKFYDDCTHCATRSRAVYCILNTGELFEFDSILHAGKWWYENYKPFGESYSAATYQRKIEASINGKAITYFSGHSTKNKGKKNVIITITNIKWFYKI